MRLLKAAEAAGVKVRSDVKAWLPERTCFTILT